MRHLSKLAAAVLLIWPAVLPAQQAADVLVTETAPATRTAPLEEQVKASLDAKKAGKPIDTLFFTDETHGIYGEENRREYYDRVLGFLRLHLSTH